MPSITFSPLSFHLHREHEILKRFLKLKMNALRLFHLMTPLRFLR